MKQEFISHCSFDVKGEEFFIRKDKKVSNHIGTIHAGAIFAFAHQSLKIHVQRLGQDKLSFLDDAEYSLEFLKPAKSDLHSRTASALDGTGYMTSILNDDNEVVANLHAKLTTSEGV